MGEDLALAGAGCAVVISFMGSYDFWAWTEFWAGLGDVFLLNSRNQGLSFRFKYCVQVRWVQSHLDIKYLVRVPLAIPLVNTSVQFSCSGVSDSAWGPGRRWWPLAGESVLSAGAKIKG